MEKINKLLTSCVSWQRPELCKKMISSFLKTRKFADLFLYICDDDPKLEEYKEMIKEFTEIKFEIGPHLYIAEVSNYASSIFDYEYYQMINDDHEFIGEGWDEEMITELDKHNGWRIAACYMPEELLKSDFIPNLINAPHTEIFSRKIIKALGYYNFPGFKQYGCDQYIMDISEDLGGMLKFCGKIYHNCCNINRMEKDDTFKFVNSKENKSQGMNVIGNWNANRDLVKEKLRRAIEDDKG